jgi:hypothetical protein
MRKTHPLLTLCVIVALGAAGAMAADVAGEPPQKNEQAAKSRNKKPMKMAEPMSGEMKREGMMKGDVKKAAGAKDAEMKPMMREEEKTMPSH